MKKIGVLLLALVCVMACAGCFCGHQWQEATCLTPRSCPLCGRVEGEALGHIWRAATCQSSRTCSGCGETQGETVDHQWEEASCAAPQHCRWCQLTEGDALEHSWLEATTEAPRTCSLCGQVDGERIITDERFATAANHSLFGRWKTEAVLTGADLRLADFVDQVPVVVTMTFSEDGTLDKHLQVKDLEQLLTQLIQVTQERVYQRFEQMDIDRETAAELFADAYHMTIEEYAASAWEASDLNGILEIHGIHGVYYVEDALLNMAGNWEGTFTACTYKVTDTALTITYPDGAVMELTRAA